MRKLLWLAPALLAVGAYAVELFPPITGYGTVMTPSAITTTGKITAGSILDNGTLVVVGATTFGSSVTIAGQTGGVQCRLNLHGHWGCRIF